MHDAIATLSPSHLRTRLSALHPRTSEAPLFNPVGQLGFLLSRELEAGSLTLDGMDRLAHDLEAEAFQARAARLNLFLSPLGMAENAAALRRLIRASAAHKDFTGFAAHWEQPALNCVFTAHPTFMLPPQGYEHLAQLAESPGVTVEMDAPAAAGITIDDEHDAALAAINRAADAHEKIIAAVVEEARAAYPAQWRALRPRPFSFGTWVGYDMDGRTDIPWTTSLRFRLKEKVFQLRRYLARTGAIADSLGAASPLRGPLGELHKSLDAACRHAHDMQQAFARPLETAEALSGTANLLTADHSGKTISTDAWLGEIDRMIAASDDATAAALIGLSAAMRCHRLGAGTVHFRINASQLHNAIRRRLDGDAELMMSSRTALARLRKLFAETEPLAVNFASLAVENTTAVRQFLAMAQILKHIDADSPIRLLIAESEQAVTALSAVYFAKLFGIDGMVDVSPLFETEPALEHGARILDSLLAEPHYQDYARRRGRVAIQTGFSDAGRFMGQIPASLAIERLQGRLASLMVKHGLQDVAAVIFNTHGESMGRGAHPSGVRERLSHAMSAWARHQFALNGIRLEPETSFQGGDGFVLFGSAALAQAFLTRLLESTHEIDAAGAQEDPFYKEVDISLDFYRAVRNAQVDFFAAPYYGAALTAFGLSLLRTSGSRKTRRPAETSAARADLSRIRAIPHNAVLQQLGYPVNVIAGVGMATESELDSFAKLHERSARAQGLLRLVRASLSIASIKTLIAYGELFDGSFWATRPYRGPEAHLKSACLALAERFAGSDRMSHFRELAAHLRVDGLKLHQLLDTLGGGAAAVPGGEEQRRTLGVLHALRLALMQHIFLKAAQIPPFSERDDISRDDIMEMIFSLRIPEAVERLRLAYPVEKPELDDFSMQEPTQYPDSNIAEYTQIHSRFIEPISRSHDIILRIGTAISHHFGAHG